MTKRSGLIVIGKDFRKIQENEGSKVNDTKLISEIKKDVDSLSEYINDISISNRTKD